MPVHKTYPIELLDGLLNDRKNGLSGKKIAAKYNIPETTLYRILDDPEKYISKEHITPQVLQCSSCYENKVVEDFYPYPNTSRGYSYECKKCRIKSNAEYYNDHMEETRVYKSDYYKQNKDRIKQKQKRYYQENKEDELARNRKYAHKHKEQNKVYKAQYYLENKEEISTKNYARKKERLKTDINFRITETLRNQLNKAVKNNYKGGSAVRDLGCSIGELKAHLEAQFYPHPETKEKMTWDNWGNGKDKWNIDHITPLCSFDNLADREQCIKACHYTNLQPLWQIHNASKGGKTDWRK